MAVRIRLKKMGRRHRPFYRLCAMDARAPRDGRVIEELGIYDPMVPETDARAILKADRIAYWLSVGAQPTEKAAILIKKYGPNGTHLEQQKAALERLAQKRSAPVTVAAPAQPAAKQEEKAPEAEAEPAAEAPAEENNADATE